ncbi:GNAT family N-acetyltransferase [Pseudoxanthomonas suwonensis]|jgi:ribosomal protein S18 acetylase RimI-like enzyme
MIGYRVAEPIQAKELAAVFEASGLSRPIHDLDRMRRMIEGADLIVSAWHGDKLVGIARAISDDCFSCYLPDLAVDAGYKGLGIGRRLLELVRESIGSEVMLVLLAVPDATEFYTRVGCERYADAFIVRRLK